MRLAVLGAGVVGVTTAYALTQDGHEVTVFERCSTVAEGASFANAGLLAPEWMGALASEEHSVSQQPSLGVWRKWLDRAKPASVASDPGAAVQALARFGAESLAELCEQLGLTPDSQQGLMVVWGDPRDSERASRLLAKVRSFGGEGQLMTSAQARELELALNPEAALEGTLVMPDTWSVNCRQFTLLLRARAQQDGCRFEFGTTIKGLQVGRDIQLSFQNDPGVHRTFDAVVLCCGAGTAPLLESAGVPLPLEIWTGHSLSAPIRESMDAPVAVVHDLRHNVSISRMGQRIRVSGPLTRAGGVSTESATRQLYEVLDEWFPGAIRHGQAAGVQEWRSDVVSTPDALPVVGQTRTRGVWINAAHGGHGWVMACGSARLLADQLAGRPTAVGASPYGATRFPRESLET